MVLTGIYVDDKNGDGWIQNGTDTAYISYIDPIDGKLHTATIWQRGPSSSNPDGGLNIDYGDSSNYPSSGWWYTGNAHIDMAMTIVPAPVPPSVFLLGTGLLGLAGVRRFRKG